MYGAIFGFHRLARCPKCTPASTSSLTRVSATTRLLLVPVGTCSRNDPGRHRPKPSSDNQKLKRDTDLGSAGTSGQPARIPKNIGGVISGQRRQHSKPKRQRRVPFSNRTQLETLHSPENRHGRPRTLE